MLFGCQIFFVWLTVSKNKRGALWILKFDHCKPIWRITTVWRDAVTWWLALTAQDSAGSNPWDESTSWAAEPKQLNQHNAELELCSCFVQHQFTGSLFLTEHGDILRCKWNSVIKGKLVLLSYTSATGSHHYLLLVSRKAEFKKRLLC